MGAALSSGNITPTQLSGRRFFIVADLTIGGAQLLAATTELEIPWAATARTLSASHYLSRSIEVNLDAGWGKSENAPGEAVVEVPIVGRLVELRRAGSLGSGIRCEVFLWVEGTDYTAREVLVTGAARLVQWGADGEAVVFNVRQDAGDSAAPVRIGVIDDSFATLGGGYAVDENLGRPYPIVFGAGGPPSPLTATVYRSEGIPYSRSTGTPSTYQRICVAGHRVEAADVWIEDSTGLIDQLPITYRQDGAGGQFATVNLVGSSLDTTEGTTYAVKWAGSGGALVEEGRILTGAGHLISYLLRTVRLPVDFARLAGARSALDAYNVAGTIQEPVWALAYVGDALASVLPFTLTSGPDGWWPWPWPISPRRSEAVAEINPARGDVSRSSELSLDSGDVINEFTLTYGLDVATGETTRTNTAGGLDTDAPLGACINSQARYGVRSESLESVVIEAPGSAARAVTTRLLALAEPRARVSYDLSTSYAWLRPRQLVMLQDADVGAFGVAVIDGMTLSELSLNATLLILTPTGEE
jgi:hypothetical protein